MIRRWAAATGLMLLMLALPTIAAEPRIAIVYDGGETTGPIELQRALTALDVEAELRIFAPGRGGESLEPDTDLGAFDVIFVDADTEIASARRETIARAADRSRLAVVNEAHGLRGNIGAHPDLAAYWSQKSQANFRGLLAYLLGEVLETEIAQAPAPVRYPAQLFHHPDAPTHFESRQAYETWYRQREDGHRLDSGALSIGVAFHFSRYAQEDIADVDATIREIEARGHNTFALASDGPVAFDPHLLDADGEAMVDVVLVFGQRLDFHDRHAGLAQAEALDVTLLSAFAHRSQDAEAYAASRTGLAPAMTTSVVAAERDGVVEPFTVGARGPSRQDRHFVEAIPEQVAWRVERAASWARLRRMDNADKRVVVTYWSEAGGRADLGGDPDDFLDVPASLVALLADLRERGYDVGDDPLPDRDALSRRMVREGANIGSWNAEALDQLVNSGRAATLSEGTYRQWFESLPAQRREEIEAQWGPPPGRIMVHEDASGARRLVLPGLDFGNIRLVPHPVWGYLEEESAMMARGATPPHHQYLAFFLWLQRSWNADAWLNLFSNIVLQPGVAEGPMADDHIGILLGGLPHIHPERLGSNGGIKNKRKGLASTPSWYSIIRPSRELETLQSLRAYLARFEAVATEEGRETLEQLIREEAQAEGLDRALELDIDQLPIDRLRVELGSYLDQLTRRYAPHGSKVLGEAAEGEALADMVAGMLGPDLRAALAEHVENPFAAAGEVVAEKLRGRGHRAALVAATGRDIPEAHALLDRIPEHVEALQAAPRERDAVLALLEGGWLEPGPIDEPVRRPESVPPGRQLYHFDPAGMPTPEAEALGREQADALIAAHRDENDGRYPKQMVFVLWSSDTTRNHGVTEAQILHLLGVRVTRDRRGRIDGVERIPRQELGRPRVDVLITASGTYRDHFPGQMDRITEAVALAAESPEPDNAVAQAVAATREALQAQGIPTERAEALAGVRVFSEAPGAYSPNIQFLARSGDRRGDEARMADLYLERLSHAYGGAFSGEYQRPAFEDNLGRTEGAVLPRSSNVNALLDQPMSAGYLGGLNLAIREVTGQDIRLYVSDVRSADDAAIQPAARELQSELRTRYFNPTWLRQMIEQGYEGARNFMFLTEQLDLWNSTSANMVSSADWQQVKSVFVDDRFDLGMAEFFDQHNPWAQQMLLVNLMGAAERGHWQASEKELAEVAQELVDSALAHGPACEAAQCRNDALTEQIGAALADVPDAAPSVAAYEAAITQARQSPDGGGGSGQGTAPSLVTGHAMESMEASAAAEPARSGQFLWLALLVIAMVLLLAGWLRAGKQLR